MDTAAFARALPALWDDFPHSDAPGDGRFAEIVDRVPGLTKPNNLALLNLAAACLPDGESYVEVGSFRGTSLIAALLDNEGKDVVAVDDFSQFGLSGATIIEGDAFEVLRSDALSGRTIGVYYYDAAHTYEQQLDGLRLVEPYLATEALLVVDDSDWSFVAKAIDDYLAGQSRASSLIQIDGKDKGSPAWWEGVHLLAWRANA